MNHFSSRDHFKQYLPMALRCTPQAEARIAGGESCPDLRGLVRFYRTGRGVLVHAEICGLPQGGGPCDGQIFGFHIHSGTSCGGSREEPFSQAMGYYDTKGCGHPHHAGDLPPLFGNDGLAVSAFLTNRFSLEEIIGKVVIIHGHPDDFTTQPSGSSGAKIACGVIRRTAGASN